MQSIIDILLIRFMDISTQSIVKTKTVLQKAGVSTQNTYKQQQQRPIELTGSRDF